MHILKLKRLVSLVLVAASCGSAVPVVTFADDGKGEPPAKPAATAKIEAPALLTERERWMLDRMEQLEKRVAELEAKGQPAVPSSSEPAASQPPAAVPATAQPGIGGTVGSGEVASVVPSAALPATPRTQEKVRTKPANAEPFAFADFTWLTGNARTKESPMDSKFFTPEIRADVDYIYDFNHPKDNSIGGSSEVFRANEVQVTQLGVGGDFHYDNVRARLMTQFGSYSQTTPRNDASPSRGQWNLDNAYRYLRRHTVATTSMHCMESMSTPESSCRISDCSATTNSTTGRISRRMFHRTRRGFSMAYAFRFFRRSI